MPPVCACEPPSPIGNLLRGVGRLPWGHTASSGQGLGQKGEPVTRTGLRGRKEVGVIMTTGAWPAVLVPTSQGASSWDLTTPKAGVPWPGQEWQLEYPEYPAHWQSSDFQQTPGGSPRNREVKPLPEVTQQ